VLQHYDPFVRGAKLPDFPVPGLSEFGLPLVGKYVNGQPDFKLPADDIEQFTEELQFQGTGLDKHLTYTVGGFYYDAKPAGMWGNTSLTFCPALYVGLCGQGSAYAGVTNKSKALYAQATMDMGYFAQGAESLRLTVGYRYTWDTVSGFSSQFRPAADPASSTCASDGAVVPTATAPTACRYDAKLESRAPTWTVGLDYKPMDDVMLYGKVSRGYKAGGLNTYAVRPETQTFRPEKLTSYEIGFKSSWDMGGVPLRLNANYYYSKYENVQRPAADFNAATQTQGAQILGARATIQGFALEGSLRPVPAIEIGGNVSYTHGRYDKFDQVVLAPQGQVACNSTIVGGAIVPVPQGAVADYSCNAFQFVTPWIFNIHASVDLPVPESIGAMSLLVNYSHVSGQNTTPLSPDTIDGVTVEPGALIRGYGLLNASLTWSDIGGTSLDATIFGTNLTNKLYRVSNSGVYQTIGVHSDMYGEPRMYGIKLRYRFGN
jgi:iron complex outermembrane receptor protein